MRDLKIYLSISAILLVVYLVAQYNEPKPVNWESTYLSKDKIPFGTYVLYQRLTDVFSGSVVIPGNRPVYNVLKENKAAPGCYIFIADGVDFSKADFEQMVNYMMKGGSIFIAANTFGKLLNDTLNVGVGDDWTPAKNNEPVATKGKSVKFTNPALAVKRYVFDKDIATQYFDQVDTLRAIVLGTNSAGGANYIRYAFGSGSLFLSPDPKLFTNYALLSPGGAEYASRALSHLKPAGTIYWDGYFTHDASLDGKSLLDVIFKYPALKKGYLIALLSLVIFVLFGIKRRQRIIPVADPLKNSTAEFVQVVGQVYYERRDNGNMARKNINYLLEHIRSKYRVPGAELSDEFVTLIAVRSGLGRKLSEELRDNIQSIRKGSTVSDQELIRLNRLIEKFYKSV